MRSPFAKAPCFFCAVLVLVASASVAEGPWFVDTTRELGVVFEHQDARFGEKYYIETAASGGGLFDVDGDGALDVYLINGAATPGSKLEGTPRNKLYVQREGRLVDATEVSGTGDPSYGMGICAGDVDADGRLDFLVTNYGPDRLFRNLGNGDDGLPRFEEIGETSGVDDPRWGASCAFGDVDGDGDLDLYVTHYVDFTFDKNPFCGDRARNLRAYCRPEAFDGVTDSLFINQGDGTFRDEATTRGLAQGSSEKGFGVVMSDVDDDGDLDLYVANDGTMNRLYINDGRGRFEDQALLSGTGLSRQGTAESGMGVDLADVDGDGRIDVLVTNYSMETNTLYRNHGDLMFDDITASTGLGEPSFKYVGWGVRFFDADNDSDLDLMIVNGHAVDNIEIFESGLSYEQPNQLFENLGNGKFREIPSTVAGPAFERQRVSRALAVGDLDGDGRLDVLVTNTNGPAEILQNRHKTSNHWLRLALAGPPSNPFAIGARIVLTAGDKRLLREVRSGGSFLAQGDLRPHFGLGQQTGEVRVEIRWPDGKTTRHTTQELDRVWSIAY